MISGTVYQGFSEIVSQVIDLLYQFFWGVVVVWCLWLYCIFGRKLSYRVLHQCYRSFPCGEHPALNSSLSLPFLTQQRGSQP